MPDTGYASVSWTADDVITAAEQRDIQITEAQAVEWLDRNGKQLRDRLVEVGWQVIDELMCADDPREVPGK